MEIFEMDLDVDCPPGFDGTVRSRTSRSYFLSRPCSAGCRACRPEEHIVHQGGPRWVPRSSFGRLVEGVGHPVRPGLWRRPELIWGAGSLEVWVAQFRRL